MFGLRFVKTQPTDFVMAFRDGRMLRQGAGLSLLYFAPTTTLVVVPTASVNEPFMFEEVTADFQEVTIQGQVTYRVSDPTRTAALLNFAVDANGRHASEDPKKLSQRLLNTVRVATMAELQTRALKDALAGVPQIVERVSAAVAAAPVVAALGLEVLGLSVLALKPKPETARALEAESREALLRRADEAIYARRNSAVEQERAIKENELNTEVAVENKRRQIMEAKMDAERSLADRRRQIAEEDLAGQVTLEQKRSDLVALATANAKQEADAKAYGIDAVMKAFATSDPRVLQALASTGMQPAQLLALAFRDIADNADKIGQLSITPDLLREIMDARKAA